MTILTAMNIAQTDDNRWKVLLYAGGATVVVVLLMILLIGVPFLPVLLGILIGAAPLVGYDLARGVLGVDWRPVIAGLIGNILFVAGFFVPGEAYGLVVAIVGILSMILWPIVVGAMSPNQSVGKLLLASLIGLVLGIIVVVAVVIPLFGQNPYSWLRVAAILLWAVWGGAVGAALSGFNLTQMARGLGRR